MKKLLTIFLLISIAVTFCSCNKTPDGSYLNEGTVKLETDTQNTHLNDSDTHVTASFTQGELKLGVDADVTAPKAQKIYRRKSDYFDFSDKDFHQLAAAGFIGRGI